MATATPIQRFRTRPAEVQAIDLGDGRHLVLEDPPRYVPSDAFNLAFELVPERRVVERRRANGNGRRPRGRQDRRKGPSRRKATRARSAAAPAPSPAPAERSTRSIEEIRAERRARDNAAIEDVRKTVDREQAQNEITASKAFSEKLRNGERPGKGRKACPKCHEVTGAAARECVCGHKFGPKS